MPDIIIKNQTLSPLDEVQAIFDALYASAKSAKSKNSLTIINNICSDIARGSRDFSQSNIAALSEEAGGPKYGAIRNKTGESYRTLISAYAAAYKQPSEKPKQLSDDWIERIEDHAQRYLTRDLENENKRLTNELNLLRQYVRESGPIIMLNEGQQQESQALPLASHLKPGELKALSKAIDPKELEGAGLQLGRNGSITDTEGNRVLKPGFVDAIEKILTVSQQQLKES